MDIVTSDDKQLQDLLAAHEAVMKQIRRESRMKLALVIAISVLLGYAIVVTPVVVSLALTFFILAWGAWVIYSLLPGRCVICGVRYTTLAVPTDEYTPQKWWDFRPLPRNTADRVCMEHFGPYVLNRMGGPDPKTE